jgi:hypothetical protein
MVILGLFLTSGWGIVLLLRVKSGNITASTLFKSFVASCIDFTTENMSAWIFSSSGDVMTLNFLFLDLPVIYISDLTLIKGPRSKGIKSKSFTKSPTLLTSLGSSWFSLITSEFLMVLII